MDFLDESPLTVPGQKYALVSFVSPTSNQKSDACALKIYGAFETKEQASDHAKQLMGVDDSFDIFLVELYKWVPSPPDPQKIENQEYNDQFLNELIMGYKKSQLEAKQHFAQRKRECMEQGLESVLTNDERIPPPANVPDMFSKPDPHPSSLAAAADAPGPSSR
jgi:hypothetical protein